MTSAAWTPEEVKTEYDQKAHLYSALCSELKTQLSELLAQHRVTLAVPIETRVKTWQSLLAKCEDNALEPQHLSDIRDLAGLRLVVLFRRDLDRVGTIVHENFDVLSEEDTQSRLSDDRFGYGSIHFEITPKDSWLELPTLKRRLGWVRP